MIDYLTVYLASMSISLFYTMKIVQNNYGDYKSNDIDVKTFDMLTFIILTLLSLVPIINTFLVIIIILLNIKDYKEEPTKKWYEDHQS